MPHLQTHEMRIREKHFMHKRVVSTGGHTIEEMKRRVRADKLLFGVSGIATWRVEMPHLQIHEMRNRESALCISAWS
jgi:hypothetical protein